MARITVIANQKGGIGKTTTANMLSAGLIAKGFGVLTIDADPQSNLSHSMKADTSAKGVFEAMSGEPVTDLIQETPNGHVLASSSRLTGADKKFSDYGAEYLLQDAIAPIKDKYQYVVIDTPPALGILVINCLIAATDLIIPLTADMYSVIGLSQLLDTIERVKKRSNPGLCISGLLLTRYTHRAILSRDLKEAIEKKSTDIGTKLYGTIIREGIAIREAQTSLQSIFSHAPMSNAAIDYGNFVNEYLNDERGF